MERTRGLSRGWSIAALALQVALGFVVAGGGAAKLAGDPVMVEMFSDIGAGQWLRPVVGLLEVAGGVGLMVPRTRALAALGLTALLLGATATNVAILDSTPLVSLGLAGAALVIVVLRRHELPAVGRTAPPAVSWAAPSSPIVDDGRAGRPIPHAAARSATTGSSEGPAAGG